MNTYIFKVEGMDCAEEIAIIKRALDDYINDEQSLGFDLLNGKLTVQTVDHSETVISKAIAATGMTALPWQNYIERQAHEDTLWKRYSHLALTSISGVCLFIGYAFHAQVHGWVHALVSHGQASFSMPTTSMVFYGLTVISGGWFVFPKALFALRRLRPDMNLLMTTAVIGAIIIGQWFEAAAVAFLFSLALLLETWSIGRARKAIKSLLDLAPQTLRYLDKKSGKVKEGTLCCVKVGMTVLVRPGEKIPVDGEISQGATHINQAPITGESMPVAKQVGDEIFAGTINGDGAFEYTATKTSNDSMLAQIIKRVEEAQGHRAHTEQWVDTFARYYTPAMMGLALLIAVIPPLLFGQSWLEYIYQALVILVIACPCALVISTPVSIVAGLSAAAKAGVLIKGGVYLELPAKLRAIAFDKTGTLTYGKPEVKSIHTMNEHTETRLLQVAASLEANSEHPIARAICLKANAEGIGYKRADDFNAIKGKGAQGNVDGNDYWLGNHRLLLEKVSRQTALNVSEKVKQLEQTGRTVVVIGREDHVCGFIGIADSVKEVAQPTISKLKHAGIEKLIMLTGDNQETARAIACSIGIDEYKAELLPDDKSRYVAQLAQRYETIAMVGDGINDAPAMATATFGIAMGAMGSDVAIETADIALMSDDLSKIPWLIKHSKRCMTIIKQNIVFSLCVKAVFIILATFGLASLWMAIAADMGTSLIVIFNGLRLLAL